jgi:hypothetical protein
MVKKLIVAVGYDNALTANDITVLKKITTLGRYELELLYYVPKIPALGLVVEEIRDRDQRYREEGCVLLTQLTVALSAVSKKSAVAMSTQIVDGSDAIYTRARAWDDVSILTSHPERLKPNKLDTLVDWLRTTHLPGVSKVKHRGSAHIATMTPQQFIEINQLNRLYQQRPDTKNERTIGHSFGPAILVEN